MAQSRPSARSDREPNPPRPVEAARGDLRAAVDSHERTIIEHHLTKHRYNQRATAKALGEDGGAGIRDRPHVVGFQATVDLQLGRGREPKRRVQDRPVLGDVDVLAPEHRVPSGGDHDLVAASRKCLTERGHRQIVGRVVRADDENPHAAISSRPGSARPRYTDVSSAAIASTEKLFRTSAAAVAARA